MANNLSLPLIFLIMASPLSSAIPTNIPKKYQDLPVAIEEMQKANYFTFVMLINMSPLDQKIQGNVTFLMPNDRTLARTNLFQESVSDFLLRHSIPSVFLFEDLEHIPSGSLITSSMPEYMLNISNGGRRSFYINNVKIISPNICTAGSSIRCHGIDGVINFPDNDATTPTCSNTKSPEVVATTPTASPPSAPPLRDPNQTPPVKDPSEEIPPLSDSNWVPVSAPVPSDGSPHKSGTSQRLPYKGLLSFLFIFVTLSIC